MNWIAVDGQFEFSTNRMVFNGCPTPFKTPQGDDQEGLALGRAICSERFAGGTIEATVEFEKIGEHNCCELILYFDPSGPGHVSGGIGGIGSAYTLRYFKSEWTNYASAGSRSSLMPNRPYVLKAIVLGSYVRLFVDGVEVMRHSLPVPVPPSQVGMLCLDDAEIRISDFKVTSQRGKVFVVMQFDSNFSAIYEQVVKKVCEELKLDTHRADETYGPGLIIDDIVRDIRESQLVIADITHANPNVYYELGYAHAINKPVILLADKKVPKLPFDVSPFRVLFYDNSIVGRQDFEVGLKKHVSAILGGARVSSGLTSA